METNTKTPKVSVVMAAFNSAETVSRAVESVLAQTFLDFELIIVDDASTDGTGAVLASIRDPRARVVRLEKNAGRSEARNLAISRARGRYVAMLDADDWIYPERLARQVEFMESNPSIALCGAWADWIEPSGRRIEWRKPLDAHSIRRDMMRSDAFIHCTVMVKRDVLLELGGYDRRMEPAEDYDLFLKIAARHPAVNLPVVLAAYRSHSGMGYRIREQWSQARVKWKAVTKYGYPAAGLAQVLLCPVKALVPSRWKIGWSRSFSKGEMCIP